MAPRRSRHAELAETLDRVLQKGAVLRGDLVLSVADVDLLYLDLRLFLSAVDTALDHAEDTLQGSPDASSDPDPANSSRASA
jgi:hypothetical protein